MDLCKRVKETAMQSGMWQAGFIDPAELVFYPEIREICRGNMCRRYGTSWTCPPAVGTLEECRERLLRYDTMLLYSNKYPLEDSWDVEGMQRAWLAFKQAVDTFHDNLKTFLDDFLLLSNEGCQRCVQCTYPDKPCRFPDRLHPAIEGYGLNISELAQKANMQYYGGPNSVTFFGGLFFVQSKREEHAL